MSTDPRAWDFDPDVYEKEREAAWKKIGEALHGKLVPREVGE